MNKMFSFKGRAGRLEYFLHNLFDDLALIIVAVLMAIIIPQFEGMTEVLALLFIVVFIAGIWSGIAVTSRRLHDLGRPGSHLFFLLIPIFNIFLGFLLLFKKGVEGPNMYDVAGGQPVQDDVRVLKDEVRDMPEA